MPWTAVSWGSGPGPGLRVVDGVQVQRASGAVLLFLATGYPKWCIWHACVQQERRPEVKMKRQTDASWWWCWS